jgi:uncharacterized protein YoxC
MRHSSNKVAKELTGISQEETDIAAPWKDLFDDVEKNREAIDELFLKKNISFMNEVRTKITPEEYRLFLAGL